MKYDNPELIDALASEYVLGTLQGAARARFQRLIQERADVQRAVWRWERELNELGPALPPQAPNPQVWHKISSRLGFETAKKLRWWRTWSAITTTAAIALAALLIVIPITREPTHFAQFADNNAPIWVISVSLDTGVLTAKAVNPPAAELDRVYELWMLPEGEQPQSLGLLPVGSERVDHPIPPGLRAILAQTSGLAISEEPPGGSPTGLPTGPVVFQATMVSM